MSEQHYAITGNLDSSWPVFFCSRCGKEVQSVHGSIATLPNLVCTECMIILSAGTEGGTGK